MDIKFVKREDFFMSFYRPEDTPAERFTFDVDGHDLQVVRCDGDNAGMTAFIDGRLYDMSPEESEAFAKEYLP